MTSFETIRANYPELPPAYPENWPAPSGLQELEFEFRVTYPCEFHAFQDEECHRTSMGLTAQIGFGWASPHLEYRHTLTAVLRSARHHGVVPGLAPFQRRDGGFLCFDDSGRVVLWERATGTVLQDENWQWPSFVAWLESTLEEVD